MRFETITITAQDESAALSLYILDNVVPELPPRLRPMVIICPGGGYGYTSPREAEPIAMQFLAAGCNAAVLDYTCAPAHYPVALCQLALSVAHIRTNSSDYHTHPDKIAVCGFSAGGHLAASLAVKWHMPFMKAITGLDNFAYQPNALILCYPVITAGRHAHKGSFENLLGADATENMLAQQSLETLVSHDVPPTFLWHTWDDTTVPVENSLLFASALRAFSVSVEMHLYPHGMHGLALANKQTINAAGRGVQAECQAWPQLAVSWLDRLFEI